MDAGERLGATCSFCGAQAGEPCRTTTTGRPTTRVHAARQLALVGPSETFAPAEPLPSAAEPASAGIEADPAEVLEPPVGSTTWLEQLLGLDDDRREEPTWLVDVRELRIHRHGIAVIAIASALAFVVLRVLG